jgi:hypothetical protein
MGGDGDSEVVREREGVASRGMLWVVEIPSRWERLIGRKLRPSYADHI